MRLCYSLPHINIHHCITLNPVIFLSQSEKEELKESRKLDFAQIISDYNLVLKASVRLLSYMMIFMSFASASWYSVPPIFL
jgi:hypothetical protein